MQQLASADQLRSSPRSCLLGYRMALPARRASQLAQGDLDLSISPYLPTIPLEGSSRVLGLNELQRLHRQEASIESEPSPTPLDSNGWRARDSLFEAPLASLGEKLSRRCDWVNFLHSNLHTDLKEAYSIPGTVPALCQRVDCNISEFVVRPVLLLPCLIAALMNND